MTVKRIKQILNYFLNELVEKQLVLPVVKDPNLFNAYIPEELGPINAIIVPSENEVNKLKNRVLEWFGKIEVNRKVFISYKRSDSTVLAQQLYNSLIKAHYIPFWTHIVLIQVLLFKNICYTNFQILLFFIHKYSKL